MEISNIDFDNLYLEKISVSGFLGKRSFSVDFSKQEGKRISIFIGPNAMGKTTLCSFVTHLLTLTARLSREKTDEIEINWGEIIDRPDELILAFDQFSLRVCTEDKDHDMAGEGTVFSFFFTRKGQEEEKTPCLEFEVRYGLFESTGTICGVTKIFLSKKSRALFSTFGSAAYPFWRFLSVGRTLEGENKKSDFVGSENKRVYNSLPGINSFTGSGDIQTLITNELNRLFNKWMMAEKRKKKRKNRDVLSQQFRDEVLAALDYSELWGMRNLYPRIRVLANRKSVLSDSVPFLDYIVRLSIFAKCVASFGDPRFANKVIIRDAGWGEKLNPFRVTITEHGVDYSDSDLAGSSSGESNYFVMFYVMCFRTNPSARVFVDEPEISLSLSEQIKIVDRIQAVFQYTKGQAILITHSPFIAAGHEDLLAEVKFNG